jgi:N-acetylmuramic acid 6-phosphate (MurNAc-6-P) etherase
MVAAITGASLPDAAAAWSKAGGSVKVAVLMLDGLTRRKAEQRLAVSGGHLRLARTPMVS